MMAAYPGSVKVVLYNDCITSARAADELARARHGPSSPGPGQSSLREDLPKDA